MAGIDEAGLSSFRETLAALEALGEPTRLRLAALLAEAELTVTELTTILGQSQPRISRHLKLLVDANLVERHREGAWAFFSLREEGSVRFVRASLAALDPDDPVLVADRTRLAEVRLERTRAADGYFARHAGDWDRLRALHVPDSQVEAALLAAVGTGPFRAVLDLGTGTGRMLTLLASRAERLVGIDANAAMLSVARANIERAGLRNAQVRQGDLYALPIERDGYDVVILHQVLHYLDDPARAIREAARALRPGGRLFVVDFAPHDLEFLRAEHAHRRLGFARDEIAGAMAEAGLVEAKANDVGADKGAKLTVTIWQGRDARILDDTNRLPSPSNSDSGYSEVA
jgi:ubiquinone/menaquinone biosynthesis C-methylase UbiE